MLVVEIQCAGCGATNSHVDGAVVLLCGTCGAVGRVDERGLLKGQAADVHRAYRTMVGPTMVEARLHALNMSLVGVDPYRDKAQWLAAMKEQVVLTALARPEHVPPGVAESRLRFSEYVRRKYRELELCTYDPVLRSVCSDLARINFHTSRDLVGDARRWLVVSQKMAARLLGHPEFPKQEPELSAEEWAQDMLRTSLMAQAAFLPPGSVERVYESVLGIDLSNEENCLRCGARRRLVAESCEYCGAMWRALDPWLEALSVSFVSTEYTNHDDQGRVASALQLLVASHYVNRSLPPAQDALRFLRHVVSSTSRETIEEAIAMMRHGYDAEIHAFLDRLQPLLDDWVATPKSTTDSAAEPGASKSASDSAAPPGASKSDMDFAAPRDAPKSTTDSAAHPDASKSTTDSAAEPGASKSAPDSAAQPDTSKSPPDSTAEDPWVIAALATYKLSRDRIPPKDRAMALVSQARLPFALGHAITASQALAFFAAAEPDLPPNALIAAVDLFLLAASLPSERDVLTTIRSAL